MPVFFLSKKFIILLYRTSHKKLRGGLEILSKSQKKTFTTVTTLDKCHEAQFEAQQFSKKEDISVDKVKSSLEYLGDNQVRVKTTISFHERIKVTPAAADRLLAELMRSEE